MNWKQKLKGKKNLDGKYNNMLKFCNICKGVIFEDKTKEK